MLTKFYLHFLTFSKLEIPPFMNTVYQGEQRWGGGGRYCLTFILKGYTLTFLWSISSVTGDEIFSLTLYKLNKPIKYINEWKCQLALH